jgi:hypothetical protein
MGGEHKLLRQAQAADRHERERGSVRDHPSLAVIELDMLEILRRVTSESLSSGLS